MLLDTRSPRFSAWLTTAVLTGVLALGAGAPRAAGWLVLAQALVFALGAYRARLAPYGVVFRLLVAPRLTPPVEFESAATPITAPPRPTRADPEQAPVRFSQAVGFFFTAVAASGFFSGAVVVGLAATAFALAAAFLNAAVGLCLACKVYPFISLYVIRRKTQGAHS